MHLSLLEARRLALRSQGLDGSWPLPAGKEGVAQAIARLGYVQIDTIAVVQRAHHHTLWARCPDYAPAMLHELQAHDRRIFEYWWAWGASYLPIQDYRYHQTRMRAYAADPDRAGWYRVNAELAREVLERIRQEGPLTSAQFGAPEGFKRGTWWDWKPAKRALERLFWTGELMVAERRNFQRIYDLPERVLPPGLDTTVPSPQEVARFVVRRALAAHGVLSPKRARWGLGRKEEITQAIHELTEAGVVVPVEIEGLPGKSYYALAELLEQEKPQPSSCLHILSPFDNAVIERARLQELFGFTYQIECYLPAEKRKYGYFTLPLLWDTRFVGRLDAKAERKDKALLARHVALEPDIDQEALAAPLAARLVEFAAFNSCEQVIVERATPEPFADLLRRALQTDAVWSAEGALP